MQVFLSWSGDDSRSAAEALKPWLQRLFPGLEVWLSAHDIEAGTPWATVLHQQLRRTEFGLLCLTPENLTAPWILYEAGALAMSSKAGCVVPLLLDVAPEKLPAPLAQFQSVRADREGAWKVVRSLNTAQGDAVPEERLQQTFEHGWPDLARALGLDVRAQLQADVLVVTPTEAQLGNDQEVMTLRQKWRSFLRGGQKRIVFDLREVRWLSSVGLSFLFTALAVPKKEDAEVVAANLHPRVRDLFAMTHLLGHVRHFPTLEEALAYFETSPAAPKDPARG
jgi:anti-anti-sigma factor